MRALMVVCVLVLWVPQAWAGEVVGRVAAVSGEVLLVRAEARLPLPAGLALEASDRIVTGHDGRALLDLRGGLTVTVAGDTELAVGGFEEGARGAWRLAGLELWRGLVRAVFSSAREAEVQIVTPLALTSVRSTEWTVEHRSGHSAVFAREGRVEVAARGETVILDAMEGTDVRDEEPPTAAVRWPTERVRDTLRRSSFASP